MAVALLSFRRRPESIARPAGPQIALPSRAQSPVIPITLPRVIPSAAEESKAAPHQLIVIPAHTRHSRESGNPEVVSLSNRVKQPDGS